MTARTTITRQIDEKTGELLAEKRTISDNKDFLMFYREHLSTIAQLSNEPQALRLFLWMVDKMNRVNSLMCSVKVMAEALDVSEPTIYRAVKHLKDGQYIKTIKSGASNIYHINAQIVWQSMQSRHQHAEFNTRVIVSENEQDQSDLFKDKAFKKTLVAKVDKVGVSKVETRRNNEKIKALKAAEKESTKH